MSPDQREQLIRLIIAAAILTVALGGWVAMAMISSGC